MVVNCRIGSLENNKFPHRDGRPVNCRIGSLESDDVDMLKAVKVNCRIGSLEIYFLHLSE